MKAQRYVIVLYVMKGLQLWETIATVRLVCMPIRLVIIWFVLKSATGKELPALWFLNRKNFVAHEPIFWYVPIIQYTKRFLLLSKIAVYSPVLLGSSTICIEIFLSCYNTYVLLYIIVVIANYWSLIIVVTWNIWLQDI